MARSSLRTISGIATIAFPLLLLAGFILHPHLFSPSMTRTADDLIAKFHHRTAYHLGHILVFIGVPCMIHEIPRPHGNYASGTARDAVAGSALAIACTWRRPA